MNLDLHVMLGPIVALIAGILIVIVIVPRLPASLKDMTKLA